LLPAADARVNELVSSSPIRTSFAISALAEGADTLFAEAALQLGVPLEIVRPFDRYVDDFATRPSRSRYRGLVEAARRETRLPFAAASVHAYEAAMAWVVRACDLRRSEATPAAASSG
jgi:hypothetical protein